MQAGVRMGSGLESSGVAPVTTASHRQFVVDEDEYITELLTVRCVYDFDLEHIEVKVVSVVGGGGHGGCSC
jgi:hypothetical protein